MIAIPYILFVLQIVLIFFLSRITIRELFYTLRRFIKNEKTVFGIVCTVFFPGTVLHEFAHFLVALVTMHRVRSISVFPVWEKNYIKLGSVVYEKKDIPRSILVGIAPIFFGLALFWFISAFQLFPSYNMVLNLLIGYIIFAVSSTMFSSKQDLVDIVYLLPILLVLFFIIYVFNIQVADLFQNKTVLKKLTEFVESLNIFLFFSLLIHATLIVLLKTVRIIFKR